MKEETFNLIWTKGIEAHSKKIVNENKNKVNFDTNSRNRILNEYNKLRDYCKVSYMRDPDGRLDRHKVCACLIIAIIKARPLVVLDDGTAENTRAMYNENLAALVGLSLLNSYIIQGEDFDDNSKKLFKNGFQFPKTNRDMRYEELFCLMLHYDVSLGHYSILALANILFLIEKYTEVANSK